MRNHFSSIFSDNGSLYCGKNCIIQNSNTPTSNKNCNIQNLNTPTSNKLLLKPSCKSGSLQQLSETVCSTYSSAFDSEQSQHQERVVKGSL